VKKVSTVIERKANCFVESTMNTEKTTVTGERNAARMQIGDIVRHKNGKLYFVHSAPGCFYNMKSGNPIPNKFGGQSTKDGKPFGPVREMNVNAIIEQTEVTGGGDARRVYVGMKSGNWAVFRSASIPTEKSHGKVFNAVMGPFKTLRAARFTAKHGKGNPHLQTVRDAERIARKYAV
jgi:hypothetical protein